MTDVRHRSVRFLPAALLGSLLLLALTVLWATPAVQAATYRTHIARVPETPTASETVRVWIDSDTAPGETAGIEYKIGSSYVKLLGTYDNTGYPGANWRADIPAQPAGTFVEYQLFTRNQSGNDYGFEGFDWSYTVAGGGGGGDLTISDARALWLDVNTIAWGGASGASYRLLYDPDGGMTSAAESSACTFPTPAAPCYVALTASGTVSGYHKNPNATGKTRLLTGLSAADARTLLKGQTVVAAYNGGGTRIAASGTQIQSVLDALYAAAAVGETLGVSYSGGVPSVAVWAPTAKSVTLRRYATSGGALTASHPMTLDPASGIWQVTGTAAWDRQFYLFDVEVYVPSEDTVVNNLVTDPWSVSLSQDGAALGDVRSQFVNLDDADLQPAGWATLDKPPLVNFEDSVIYEVHVRDFSINDSSVATASHRGTYKAFTHADSDGMNHLQALQAAGLTHIHLLPAFDIASVIEPVGDRTEPSVPGAARDSDAQQAAVGASRTLDGFNWGYDPYHYGVPEGSYSTDPNGVTRILEFREMVAALNQSGLRVVMDVVYNHTAASGQGDKSVLDKVVPGYYHRYTAEGALYMSSCCDDTASEYVMMEKLMLDTLIRFASDYKVDGFRFDLMNFHTRQNMLNVQAAINAIDPEIYLYGEGWTFGSALEKGLTTCPHCFADKYNMTGAGIGLFNDILRDAAHGGYSTDSTQIRAQGFTNGLSYDWNGFLYSNRDQAALWAATDRVRSGLRGSGSDWNGQGSPFTDDPQEAVNYIEKHDNETLFDQNVFKLPGGTSMADRVRSQNMGVSVIGLAQGVPFFHMGQDILRSKSLDRNSYDSGDWFNRVFWDRSSNNFGVGLPPAWDNSSRWGIMGPLLANTALDPATADMNFAAAHMRETLRIRNSSPLFRLTSEALINSHVTHYPTNTGSHDGLIVMKLSDGAGIDPTYETLLVFFNANKIAQTFTIADAAGLGFALHPLHSDGIDDDAVITGGAAVNDATGAFTIPARTTAVFVADQLVQPASTIDWVGKLWPRGGVPNQIAEGNFAPAGFDVYVRVYEAGVTPTAGAPAGISCFLHWGPYGGAFSDVPMTWNTQIGNDDEFKATLSQATLNALPPGTYGFTAYCQRAGEARKWKVDQYDIDSNPADDDQGDGLITVVPAANAHGVPDGSVFVHLFEWPWNDIAQECDWLGAQGYTAVQVSPPNEHIVPTANQGGDANSDYPWWARYQPVSHDLTRFTSRSGSWAEFEAMIAACDAAGVGIYVDAIVNHMAYAEVGDPPTGTAGSTYENGFGNPASRFYGTQYAAADFHTDCDITSYADRYQVQTCKLSGLPDLHTGRAATQDKLRAYLQALLDAGVQGFRIDGAKHMPAHEIAAILDGLSGDYYLFQEVIDQSASERVRDWEYTPNGDVTEFAYAFALGAAFDDTCSGALSDLETRFTQADMLPSRFAQVFTDNHDNQRGHGVGAGCVLDHRDGQEHVLGNVFVLAHPYGHPSIMSSYYWSNDSENDAGDSMGPPTVNGGPGSSGATLPVHTDNDGEPDNCAAAYTFGKWACEHRRTSTANMVGFRRATAGADVTNWQNIGGTPSDHIAFGRGDQGFVAINRTGSAAVTTYQTDMAAGTYCDVIEGGLTNGGTACTGRTIEVNASGQIVSLSLASMQAFAIHADAKVSAVPTQVAFSQSPVAGSVATGQLLLVAAVLLLALLVAVALLRRGGAR